MKTVVLLILWWYSPFIEGAVGRHGLGIPYVATTTILITVWSLWSMLQLNIRACRAGGTYHPQHFVPMIAAHTAMTVASFTALYCLIFVWRDAGSDNTKHVINGQSYRILTGLPYGDEYLEMDGNVRRWASLIERGYSAMIAGAIFMLGMFVFVMWNERAPVIVDTQLQARRVNSGYTNGKIITNRRRVQLENIHPAYTYKHTLGVDMDTDTEGL